MSLFIRFARHVAALFCVALPALATAQIYTTAHPEVRVLTKVDSAVRTTLAGNVPASVASAAIGGRLKGATQLDHVMLMLKATDTQEAALHTLLDAQQDKNSPVFHKWLTPDTFAQSFGVADADVAKVTAWLQDSGFAIEQVSRSKRIIQFSGSVSSVEGAFTTEIHNVTINGEAHISNTSDISVPAALAPVVLGIARLNDIFPKTDAHFVGTVAERRAAETAQAGGVTPEYGTATGTHYVSPGDVAKIFNATPLLNASSPIDGTGVTIAVLARSNIDLGDVAAFRAMFGLPAKNPTVTVVGSDPGKNGDDTEAYLDAEWAGAVAPNANINFIVNSASLVSGGTDGAALYAVDNNIGDIISLSYGGCEANFGASGTAFWNVLWEQAAAQGQTAMVSSGDSGAAGCDSSSATYATHGYGVNALGVSAYNVSVGGSMFVDFGSSQYWGATGGTSIPFANALSYVPEAALNQSRLTSTLLNSASTATTSGSGIFSGGGGISLFTARPSWQTGSGISATADPTDYNGNAVTLTGSTVTGPHRLSPDVALISANGHDGTLFCAGGICRTTSTGTLGNAGIVGGTSVATPVMASAQALINQKNGGRQGNTNIYYYSLANSQYASSTTACQAMNGTAANPAVTLPAATCNFQDIVAGSIVVPTAASGTAGIGFNAAAGYDPATGLGSVNIANVANNWASVNFNATATTLSLTPTSGITHGSNQTASITVTPASGTGTPTGDVSLIASIASTINGYSAPQVFTLSGGSVNGTLNSLPAGTYSVYAHYAGDTTFASSNSAPVTVTIGKENSTTNVYNYYVTTTGGVASASTFTYASNTIYLDAEVAGTSQNGTASGALTFNVTRNGSTLPSLTTTLDTYGTTYLQSGPGYANYYLLPNYGTLTPGNYSVTANYAGDANFNPSTATTNFTVTQATPTSTLTTPTAQITSGQQATLTFTVTPPTSAAAAATGTVVFVDTTTNTTLGSANLNNGTASINTTAITASGANSITATYGGDTNYATTTATTTITVGTGTAPTISVAAGGTLTVGATVTLTATLSAAPAASSTISFYDGTVLLGSTTTSATAVSVNYSRFTAGAHSVTAFFGGNASQSSSTSAVTNVSIAKNTTAVAITAGPVTQNYGTVALSGSITRSPSTTAAPAVPLTGTVSVYDIAANPAVLLGTATPAFDPAGYSTYAFSFTSATLSGGTHTIQVVYSGDANYNGATAPNTPTLTVAKLTPTLAVTAGSVVYGTATTTLTGTLAYGASTAPTGAITFSVDGGATVAATCSGASSPLTCVANNYATFSIPAGNHTITLSYAGDTNYNAASGTAAFTVTKATASLSVSQQSVVYATSTSNLTANVVYGGSAAPQGAVTLQVDGGVVATATCSGSASPLTCTASYNTSTLSVGAHTINVSLAAGPNYNAVTGSGTLNVTKATATVTLGSLTATYDGNPHAATATTTPSGLSVSITYNGSTTAPTAAGSYAVVATVNDNNYNGSANGTLVISQGTAAITFAVANHTYGDAPFTVSASSASTGAFTYSVVSGPATISGNTVTLTGAGTVVLQASQAADANYTANAKQASFTVAPGSAAITFAVANHTYGDAPFTVSASSASTGAFTYSVVSGPATMSGNIVTLTGAGTVVLQASQAADANYTANAKQASFTVAPGSAAITFAVANHTYGDAAFTVSASSASTGAFTYSVVSGPATISGNTVTLTGAGTVVLQASQAADANYVANTKQTSFAVAPAATTTSVSSSSSSSTIGTSVTFTATVSAAQGPVPSGSVVFSDGGTVLGTATLTNGVAMISTSSLGAGSHVITAAYQANGGDAASSGSVTQVVVLLVTTTTVSSSQNPSVFAVPVTLTATVTSGGNKVAAGTVVFSEGSTTLATVTLTNGTAAYTTSSSVTSALAVGSHTIVATFQPTAAYAGSSNSVTQVISVPTFSLTDNGASSLALTIARGSSASTTITATPTPSFTGTVSFTCTNLPTNAACIFSNPTLTFTGVGGAQTTDLRIDSFTQIAGNQSPMDTRIVFAFGFPGLLLIGLGGRKRKQIGSRRLMMLVFLLLGLVGAATLTGCGSDDIHKTPAGTYTVNVVATSGTQTQTLPVTLTIQ